MFGFLFGKRKAIAPVIASPFAAPKYSDFKWGRTPPTEKQFRYALHLGISPQNGWTKKKFSEAISAVAPASEKDLAEIASLGGVLPRAITSAEAEEVLDILSGYYFRCPSCGDDCCAAGETSCNACGVKFKKVQIPITLPKHK